MEVDPTDIATDLVKADVVESLKGCTVDLAHSVVRNKEVFLPAHEDVFSLGEVLVVEMRVILCLSREGAKGWEATPVRHVGVFVSAPVLVVGLEGVFGADNLAFEVGRQGRVVFREACRGLVSWR